MYVFTLPSGMEIELREMTGTEEEILTNQRLLRKGEAVNQVLQNCVLRLGENTNPSMTDALDLLSGDRLFALVRLRQVSLGDEVDLELVCPNPTCRERNMVTVNLDDLEVTPYGPEREFEFVLPQSEKTVRFRHLDGHMEKRLATLKEPNVGSAMLMRVLTLDGKAPSKKAFAELPLRDRAALRKEMARVEGGIDTTVEVSCDACGTMSRTRLEGEGAFLFPGVPF